MVRRLRVALDGEPLLALRTGVSRLCEGLLASLAELETVEVGAYAVTWRTRAELARRLPPGVRLVGRPMPARPFRALWQAGIDVPLEPWVGPFDVVHGTNSVVPPTWRAPRVVTVNDLSPLHFPEACHPATLAYPGLIRRAIRRGAWVHTLSEHVAAEVVEAFGADPGRVRAVAPGIPPLPAANPAPKGQVAGLERYVLAVGTVEPRKDYPSLVRAFDRLAAGRPGLGLVIVGSDAWGAEELRRVIAASPHRARILRPGWQSDEELAGLLRRAAVLAYPSRYEGFGFPPLQAMAAGTPVVATAGGSIPEVVGDGALTVPVGDVDALAAALALVLDDEEAAAELARAGRRRAGAFRWSATAEHLAELYRQVTSGR
jgi:glycosyltransferase involved in cell wall biosynthesis